MCCTTMLEVILKEKGLRFQIMSSFAFVDPEHGKYKAWGIRHSLYMWHGAKSLSKKLQQAGSMKNQTRIQVWRRDIVNHFWYCSKQTAAKEPFKMMWVGVLHHVGYIHG
ncbi:hypothetical protein UPYG_G00279410 [Umbra pygmaea]|uniref:Uncharacterized protein n=1 Tax=Umbra pygmaea TaxID=75934 RepID=A0ABD0W2V2_UMBPY